MSTIVENHQLRSCLWFVSLLKEHRELTFEQIDQYWQQETALSDGAPLPKRTFHDRLNSIQASVWKVVSVRLETSPGSSTSVLIVARSRLNRA